MRYLLLIYGPSDQMGDPSPDPSIHAAWIDYTNWLASEGLHLGGEALRPTSTATTVRVRGGERLVTDGPFAETREVLGGYYLLEAADIDRAIEAAARCPGARYGSIELRPIAEMPDMPRPDAARRSAAAAGGTSR